MVIDLLKPHWLGLSDTDIVIVIGNVIAGVGAFAWMCLFVRCPKCKARVVWMNANAVGPNQFLEDVLENGRCPRCGYPE